MRPFLKPINQTVTVRLTDDELEKVDALSVLTNRSRADTLRQIIKYAAMTGAPDLMCPLPGVGAGDET